MEILELVGRLLFVGLFLSSGLMHLRERENMTAYARSSGTPAPQLMVPLSGLMMLAGGVMVALGVLPDLGALLIAAFVIPTAFLMHAFWKESDPMMAMNQRAHFMKNLSIGGGALALAAFYAMCPGEGFHLTGPLL